MDFIDLEGEPQGLGVDYIHALNHMLGKRLIIVPGAWDDIYRRVKEKDGLDALMDITPRTKRKEWFNFTVPYVAIPHTVFAKKGGKYYSAPRDLNGATVAVEKGFYLGGVMRSGKWGNIKVVEYPSTSEALFAVSVGKADAYAGNQAVALYVITNELIPGLEPQCRLLPRGSINAIGVRKDWPILASILTKALKAMDRKEKNRIMAKWSSNTLQVAKSGKSKDGNKENVKSAPRKGYDWTIPGLGMKFVWLKKLNCWVGKYEVTNKEYEEYDSSHDSGHYRNHSLNGRHQPVVYVNYKDAMGFIKWLNEDEKKAGRLPTGYEYSLPTAKEWQAIVQCGDNRKYPWGNGWPPKYGNYHDKSGAGSWAKIQYYDDKYPVTCPVESSGKNDLGLYGVGGNAWEVTIKSASDSSFALWRGASWRFSGTGFMKGRCLFKSSSAGSPDGRLGDRGFRVVLAHRK